MVYDRHASGRRTPEPVDREGRDGQAAEQLRELIDRIERLVDSRMEIARELDSLYHEAWNSGFNVRILRRVVLMRRLARRGCPAAEDSGPSAAGGPAGLTERYLARYGSR